MEQAVQVVTLSLLLVTSIILSAIPSFGVVVFSCMSWFFLTLNKFKVINPMYLLGFVVLCVLMFLISVAEYGNVLTSAKISFRYIGIISIPFIAYRVLRPIHAEKYLLIAALIPLTLLPFSNFYLTEEYTGRSRYMFIFSHPNHFAYSILPVFIYHISLLKNNINRIAALGTLLLLFISKSSGAILVAFLIVCLKYRRRVLSLSGISTLSLCFVAAWFGGFMDKVIEQFSSLIDGSIFIALDDGNLGGEGSLVWRIVYWSKIVTSYLDQHVYTVLIGEGLGSMSGGSYAYEFMYTDPHNDVIRIIVESGLFGCIFLLLIFKAIFSIFKNVRVYALLTLTLPMLIGNVVVNPLFLLNFLICFYLLSIKCYEKNIY